MKTALTPSNKRIEYWSCFCEPCANRISVTEEFCPYCAKPMPQETRNLIYRQVSREIRRRHLIALWSFLTDCLLSLARGVTRFVKALGRFVRRNYFLLFAILALFVVISAGGWLIGKLPAVFDTVGDFLGDIFDGPLEFFRDLLPEKAKDAATAVPKEKDPFTFQKFWGSVKPFFGWIGDLFVWIFELLKKLWKALVWLWKAIIWIGKLILGLAVVLFYLLIELFELLFNVIKFLFSLF